MIIDQLKPFLQENWKKTSFNELTPIQSKVIPSILDGRDVIAESPTGTGKTLAYLLPLLNRIDAEKQYIQSVILLPTRELVMQIQQEISKWTMNSGIVHAAFIGGADIKRQIEKLKSKPQIVVGTPGRIMELLNMKKMKIHEAQTIVVDEADQLFSLGFIDTVKEIVKRTLKERQLLFFSATIPKQIEQIGMEIMNSPEILKINPNENRPNQVDHSYLVVEKRDKIDYLRRIANIAEVRKAIVFTSETSKMDEIQSKLVYKGIKLEVLNNETKKTDRERILRHFRENKFPILLTTDVAARGLDFQQVSHVIHFDLPEELDKYIHRSGRTGRMGATGAVISLITTPEESRIKVFAKKSRILIRKIELFMGKIVDKK